MNGAGQTAIKTMFRITWYCLVLGSFLNNVDHEDKVFILLITVSGQCINNWPLFLIFYEITKGN